MIQKACDTSIDIYDGDCVGAIDLSIYTAIQNIETDVCFNNSQKLSSVFILFALGKNSTVNVSVLDGNSSILAAIAKDLVFDPSLTYEFVLFDFSSYDICISNAYALNISCPTCVEEYEVELLICPFALYMGGKLIAIEKKNNEIVGVVGNNQIAFDVSIAEDIICGIPSYVYLCARYALCCKNNTIPTAITVAVIFCYNYSRNVTIFVS